MSMYAEDFETSQTGAVLVCL